MRVETELRARVSRTDHGECGVKTCEVLWAGKHSPFTRLFEAFAVKVLESTANVKAAAKVLGIGRDAAHRIMKRAVDQGLAKRDVSKIRRAGVDEKCFLRGQDYVSTLCDLDGMRDVEVGRGRTEADVRKLLAATLVRVGNPLPAGPGQEFRPDARTPSHGPGRLLRELDHQCRDRGLHAATRSRPPKPLKNPGWPSGVRPVWQTSC